VNPQKKQQLVRQYLEHISPDHSIESLGAGSSLKATLESIEGEKAELAEHAVELARQGKDLPEREMMAMEAIILPGERPVIDIQNGIFDAPIEPFEHFDADPIRSNIQAAIPSIGRIEIPDSVRIPYAGTGFVVGDGLLMTNRHVAELFAVGLGRQGLSFRSGNDVKVDFVRENLDDDADYFDISEVIMIHPYWDMALLRVEGLSGNREPLTLSIESSENLFGCEVAVVGYPALDPRNNIALQNEIFGGRFNVKRMQPGRVNAKANLRSFGKMVETLTHDSSTLGGNSGSAVIDTTTGKIVALHFAGIYLEANYAVSAADMARDSRIVDSGVQFDGSVPSTAGPWIPYWSTADSPKEVSPSATKQSITVGDGTKAWTVPLTISIQLGDVQTVVSESEVITEKAPVVDSDFSNRSGYDDEFLGITLPPPSVSDEDLLATMGGGGVLIPYEHFSLVMHKERRLAAFVAGNIDKSPEKKEPELGKDYSRNGLNGFTSDAAETWLLDPRIPTMHQLPDRFFTKDNKAFDKGHIFRREAATWGDDYAQIQRANGDTFHVTNCSPQVLGFNRSNRHGIWGKLENKIGKAEDDKLVVFAGPVLAEDDPVFAGVDEEGSVRVRIPTRYWKIVIARNGDQLESYAFILEQDLSDVPLEFQVDDFWRERMVSIPDLEEGLSIVKFPDAVHDSDQFGIT
jgi:endonuclease G